MSSRAASTITTAEAVEFHELLVDALDRGDNELVRRLFVGNPLLYVVDRSGRPVALRGRDAVDDLVWLWALDVEDPEPTKLSACSVLTEDDSKTVVLFELERPMGTVRYLRGTSVLTEVDGQDGRTFKVQHLHVSPAEREDY